MPVWDGRRQGRGVSTERASCCASGQKTRTPIKHTINEEGIGMMLETNDDGAAVVTQVDGLAKESGIQAGDVLWTINETKVSDINDGDGSNCKPTASTGCELAAFQNDEQHQARLLSRSSTAAAGWRPGKNGTVIVCDIDTGPGSVSARSSKARCTSRIRPTATLSCSVRPWAARCVHRDR